MHCVPGRGAGVQVPVPPSPVEVRRKPAAHPPFDVQRPLQAVAPHEALFGQAVGVPGVQPPAPSQVLGMRVPPTQVVSQSVHLTGYRQRPPSAQPVGCAQIAPGAPSGHWQVG